MYTLDRYLQWNGVRKWFANKRPKLNSYNKGCCKIKTCIFVLTKSFCPRLSNHIYVRPLVLRFELSIYIDSLPPAYLSFPDLSLLSLLPDRWSFGILGVTLSTIRQSIQLKHLWSATNKYIRKMYILFVAWDRTIDLVNVAMT